MTIVFVNLIFKDQNNAEVLGPAIQEASVHINAVVRFFRGQINKVFMFDKVSGREAGGPVRGLKSGLVPSDAGGRRRAVLTLASERRPSLWGREPRLRWARPCGPGAVLSAFLPHDHPERQALLPPLHRRGR